MIELRFKKLFLSFGTLQGNAIKSSDFYSYLCEIFVGKLDGEFWANKTQDLAPLIQRVFGQVRLSLGNISVVHSRAQNLGAALTPSPATSNNVSPFLKGRRKCRNLRRKWNNQTP
jgi:hypothetical protein